MFIEFINNNTILILSILGIILIGLFYAKYKVDKYYEKKHQEYLDSLTEEDKIILEWVKDFQKSVSDAVKTLRLK